MTMTLEPQVIWNAFPCSSSLSLLLLLFWFVLLPRFSLPAKLFSLNSIEWWWCWFGWVMKVKVRVWALVDSRLQWEALCNKWKRSFFGWGVMVIWMEIEEWTLLLMVVDWRRRWGLRVRKWRRLEWWMIGSEAIDQLVELVIYRG